MSDLSVCVVGLGYIGLPTAVMLANGGADVVGFDVKEASVQAVNNGQLPFVEHGFETLLQEAVGSGRLRAQSQVSAADAYILAVPSPLRADKSPDLSYVLAAAAEIAPAVRKGDLVVLESTVPPGATRSVARVILELRPDLGDPAQPETSDLLFAHCPERVLPGRIAEEMRANDRVIGGMTTQAGERAREVYSRFCDGEMLITDDLTAELTKLVENSFRDVNIAFANELSIICDELGANVWEVISLANRHPRVNILRPGPGVGGHCIAVDPWFLVAASPDNAKLVACARRVNDRKSEYIAEKIRKVVSNQENPIVGVFGLAFKADIDDLRESPAVAIVKRLLETMPSGRVLIVEPHVSSLPESLSSYPGVELADADAVLANATCVAILVDHSSFSSLEFTAQESRPVIDTRGLTSVY